jgi:DNA-directed RNA polymerase specialized sigma24 family protein
MEKLRIDINSLSSEEKRKEFSELFYTIPPNCKTIVELFVFGDLTYSDISEIMSISKLKTTRVIELVSERIKVI